MFGIGSGSFEFFVTKRTYFGTYVDGRTFMNVNGKANGFVFAPFAFELVLFDTLIILKALGAKATMFTTW